MRMGLALIAATAMLLSGCGGGDDDSSGATESATSDAPVATTTTPAVPVVSEKTICDLAFNGSAKPLQDAVAAVKAFSEDPDPTKLDTAKLEGTRDEIGSLAARAPESLKPHLEAEAETLQTLIDAAADPTSGQQIGFETFKSSGIEITNVCVPLL